MAIDNRKTGPVTVDVISQAAPIGQGYIRQWSSTLLFTLLIQGIVYLPGNRKSTVRTILINTH